MNICHFKSTIPRDSNCFPQRVRRGGWNVKGEKWNPEKKRQSCFISIHILLQYTVSPYYPYYYPLLRALPLFLHLAPGPRPRHSTSFICWSSLSTRRFAEYLLSRRSQKISDGIGVILAVDYFLFIIHSELIILRVFCGIKTLTA